MSYKRRFNNILLEKDETTTNLVPFENQLAAARIVRDNHLPSGLDKAAITQEELDVAVIESEIPTIDLTGDSPRDIIQTRSKLNLTSSVFKFPEPPKRELTEAQILSNPKLIEKIRRNIKHRQSVYDPAPFSQLSTTQESPRTYNTRSSAKLPEVNIKTEIKEEIKIEKESPKKVEKGKVESWSAQSYQIRRQSLRMQEKAAKTQTVPPKRNLTIPIQKEKQLKDEKSIDTLQQEQVRDPFSFKGFFRESIERYIPSKSQIVQDKFKTVIKCVIRLHRLREEFLNSGLSFLAWQPFIKIERLDKHYQDIQQTKRMFLCFQNNKKNKKIMDNKKKGLVKPSASKTRKSISSNMVLNPLSESFKEELKKRKRKKGKTQLRRPAIKMPSQPDSYSNINKVMVDTINMTLHFADKHLINDSVAIFRGEITGKRYVENKVQYLVRWSPYDVIDEEWIDEPKDKKNYRLVKYINVKDFTHKQRLMFYRYHEPINQTKRTRKPISINQRSEFVKEASLDSGIIISDDHQNDSEDKSESSSNADSNDSCNLSIDSKEMFKDHKIVFDDNRNVLDLSKAKTKSRSIKQPPPKNIKRKMRSMDHSDDSYQVRKSRRLSINHVFAKENFIR